MLYVKGHLKLREGTSSLSKRKRLVLQDGSHDYRLLTRYLMYYALAQFTLSDIPSAAADKGGFCEEVIAGASACPVSGVRIIIRFATCAYQHEFKEKRETAGEDICTACAI